MNLIDYLLTWGINAKEFVGGAAGGIVAAISDPKIKNFAGALRHVITGALIAGYCGPFLADKMGMSTEMGRIFFSFCIGVCGMYGAELIKQWLKNKFSKLNKDLKNDTNN